MAISMLLPRISHFAFTTHPPPGTLGPRPPLFPESPVFRNYYFSISCEITENAYLGNIDEFK
jgi:hypothetical protein